MAEREDVAIDASTGAILSMTTTDETDELELGPKNLDVATREALSMINGTDDIIFGRMPQGSGGDLSDFDSLPARECDIDEETHPELFSDTYNLDETDLAGDGEDPAPFESPSEDQFPVFRAALRHFQKSEAKPRVVRFDTLESHDEFICEQAVKELDRRVTELRALIDEHMANPAAHQNPKAHVLRQSDVLGAARGVMNLRRANTSKEAVGAFTTVPLELPEFAQGKVHCWRDGDCVICSMHFTDSNGSHRIATAASKPSVDADEVAAAAMRRGIDPTTVLGALPDLASVAVGKRLVKDVASAALKAREHADVIVMGAEPVLLTNGATDRGTAPLAALMYLQQKADEGHRQSQVEMSKIRLAAQTVSGKKIAGPLLDEVQRRLSEGKRAKAESRKPTLRERIARGYALAAGW